MYLYLARIQAKRGKLPNGQKVETHLRRLKQLNERYHNEQQAIAAQTLKEIKFMDAPVKKSDSSNTMSKLTKRTGGAETGGASSPPKASKKVKPSSSFDVRVATIAANTTNNVDDGININTIAPASAAKCVSAARRGEKLTLRLFPLCTVTHDAVASVGQNPFRELIVPYSKRLASICRHLASKFSVSDVALFSYTEKIMLANGQHQHKKEDGANESSPEAHHRLETAGQLFEKMGEPRQFRLMYSIHGDGNDDGDIIGITAVARSVAADNGDGAEYAIRMNESEEANNMIGTVENQNSGDDSPTDLELCQLTGKIIQVRRASSLLFLCVCVCVFQMLSCIE